MSSSASNFLIFFILTTRSGYNPPQFVIDAAKEALDRVECNQYSPTKVRVDEKRRLMYGLLSVYARVGHG